MNSKRTKVSRIFWLRHINYRYGGFIMKKKMNIQKWLLLLFVLNTLSSYSQDVFTQELLWASKDSIEALSFQDKNQINEWGKAQLPFSSVNSKDIIVDGTKINVVLVSGCSGIACWNIYVFTEKEGVWYLAAKTNARLTEQLMLDTDIKNEKIIFKTPSCQIGELPFAALKLSFDKAE
jgi:hypothetical protein